MKQLSEFLCLPDAVPPKVVILVSNLLNEAFRNDLITLRCLTSSAESLGRRC